MNYKDITIEEAEILYNNNIDIICNADKREITFDSIITNIINNIAEVFKEIEKVINEVGKKILQAYSSIKEYTRKLFNKKISKRKFIKLLQSRGLQRNNINKLIKNNKDKYTVWRLILSIPPNF